MTILIGAVMILAVFFITVMIIDCNRFVIKEYTCEGKGLKKDGTFILLSDLHNKSFGKENSSLTEAVDKWHPDGILVAGDMFTAAKKGEFSVPVTFLSSLSGKYPVYYGNGNHEYRTRLYPEEYGTMYEDYRRELNRIGIEPLINGRISLPAFGIDIYGLEIDRKYYQKFVEHKMDRQYLNKLLGKPDQSSYSILIAHNPEYFKAYAEWGADLTVSGHVHGGLMKLPFLGGVISPKLKLFPHYDGGLFQEGKAMMVLSRGLGTHTLPIRIFNPGELIVIHLKAVD